MRILVVGAGAVGGYFGGRLAAAGRDVTFLVRSGRAAQLQRDGLRIVSPSGDLALTVKTISAAGLAAPYDLILLAVKAYTLEAAMQDFAPAVGPGTMILPLLNGMRHIGALAARFGANAVLGGTSHISADLDADGRIVHLGALEDLNYGELSGERTLRLQALEAALAHAGFGDTLSPDITALMWRKWVVLASLGSITCLLRGTIGEVASTPRGVATAHAIVAECAAIAAAEGYPTAATELERMHDRLTRQGSDLTASMYRDLHKGAPVEVDQILGDLLDRADRHSLQAPLVRAAFVQLSIYEKSRPV